MSAIFASSLSVRYGARLAIHELDLRADAGSWTAVVGPNGSGKSSLLRALAGLVRFLGRLRVAGCDVRGLDRRRLARLVALVPQEPVAPERMSVRRYVLLGRTPHLGMLGGLGVADRDACEQSLSQMGLLQSADRPVGELSGGERQRAVLARALAQQAPILLLDEATSALDLRRQHDVLETVDGLRAEHGLTVVSSMHDLTLAGQYADRIVLLDGGRAVAYGTPAEILREEFLSEHYDVPLRVMECEEATVVVPLRRRSLP
ncbi:MAG TPA: ABC transporter ATP-binding protein [Solirubrobacteraceae bacterium]|nr:ABC transporter ATP-binding protein [Solirubrobacteraceae bacterium]